MVDKCVVVNCVSSYKTGEKKSSFHFLQDKDQNETQIYFANRKNWLPFVICIDHFEKMFIEYGKK